MCLVGKTSRADDLEYGPWTARAGFVTYSNYYVIRMNRNAEVIGLIWNSLGNGTCCWICEPLRAIISE